MTMKVKAGIFPWLERYRHIVIPLGVLYVGFAFFLMKAVADLRVSEMQMSLTEFDSQKKMDRSFGLLARFKLNHENPDSELWSLKSYMEEQRLLVTLANEVDVDSFLADGSKIGRFFAAKLVAIMNFLMATDAPALTKDNALLKLKDLAYFYEHRRSYQKALTVYQLVLDRLPSWHPDYPYLHLHMGFCEGLSGKLAEAIVSLKRAEALSSGNPQLRTASEKLRGHIGKINDGRNKILSAAPSANQAIDLYRNLSYYDAIVALDKLIQREPEQRLFFYRGRSYEEIGESKKAIGDYYSAIYKFGISEFTKLANRRLYVLGAFYENHPNLRDEAKQRAESLADTEFIQKSEEYLPLILNRRPLGDPDASFSRGLLKAIERRSQGRISADDLSLDLTNWSTEHARLGKKILGDLPADIKANGKLLPDPAQFIRKDNLLKVLTRDGNAFIGYVQAEDGKHLTLLTEVGRIKIEISNIVARQRSEKK
jgi:tetratricopeptide (TPR) repeat protein